MKKSIKLIKGLVLIGVIAINCYVVDSLSNDLNFDTITLLKKAFADGPESNGSGSGLFYYEYLDGNPQFCTLYKLYNVHGTLVSTSENQISASGGFSVVSVSGVKERCPRSGSGCTVYSCQQTN